MIMNDFSFVFFGTPDIAVVTLEALRARDLVPALIVTARDMPQGRGLHLTPSPVHAWADTNNIPVTAPAKLSDEEFLNLIRELKPDVGVVVAYGKILPQALLDLFPKGMLNMHPSLLPRHRGPSPIESQILLEEDPADVGVSVMLLDEAMDHGPVLAQKKALPAILAEWPTHASRLYSLLAHEGGELLADTLPRWVSDEIVAQEQNHGVATYCAKIKKGDALLDLSDDARTNYRKILAYDMWPRAFFMHMHMGKQIRVIVTDATYENDALMIKRVIPEGKREMSYEEFLTGHRS
jgi:methionyl-tRNA formyltransferase